MILSKWITQTGYEVTFSGIVTVEEMFEIGQDFKRHLQLMELEYILMWFTDVENMLIDTPEIKKLAELDQAASEGGGAIRFAVATDSPLVFGVARMWKSYYGSGPWELKVFDDLDEARGWVHESR